MDRIKEYDSDSPTSEENEDIFVPESRELDARSVRKVYLITHSQVDEELFPTRRSFVDAVLQSFNDCNVVQWCCSLEQHISAGVRYHMAIKLDQNKRWISSKRFLLERRGISVHCSNNIFLLVFAITWPSSWTKTNGGFPAKDFYWRGVGSQSISPKFTRTIIARGSMS